jgi:hypothetical protein
VPDPLRRRWFSKETTFATTKKTPKKREGVGRARTPVHLFSHAALYEALPLELINKKGKPRYDALRPKKSRRNQPAQRSIVGVCFPFYILPKYAGEYML